MTGTNFYITHFTKLSLLASDWLTFWPTLYNHIKVLFPLLPRVALRCMALRGERLSMIASAMKRVKALALHSDSYR